MFWAGFEKRAISRGTVAQAGVLAAHGALIGASAGSMFAVNKSKKILEGMMNEGGKTDAKKEFQKLKKYAPGVKHLTTSDITKHIKTEKKLDKVQIWQGLRDTVEVDNAFALDTEVLPEFVQKQLPKQLQKTKVIATNDKVRPSTIAHEIGHMIDFAEIKKSPFLSRIYKKYLRSTVKSEEAAWEKAPGKGFEEDRDRALATYKMGRNFPLYGAMAGAVVAGAIPILLKKFGSQNETDFWDGFNS